ncbi:MAG: sensor histidine kinase, partial [Pseudomonadota bacterium]
GDRDLIFQAVANLVDNALKYTPDGGSVRLSLARRADTVVLSVSDTGGGIPEQEFDKVTRRFYRVDSSRSEPGSGLGLSLVQAVADQHKASLRFSNEAPGLCVELAFSRLVV